MSNTPETDANLWDHGDEIDPSMRPDSSGDWVPKDFARKLERERDEWRKCAEELARIIDDLDAHDEPTLTRINESVDRFRRLKEASK